MSLDVYLSGEPTEEDCVCACCEHHHKRTVRPEFYSSNITHNLNTMAEEAGIYMALWRPDELGITKASGLIPLLEAGLSKLVSDPEKFKAFNPKNGWGSYKNLVDFSRDYLEACKANPAATVGVSR